MKLKADAGLRTKNQTLKSADRKDSSNIVKIYGQHISHKLEYMVRMPQHLLDRHLVPWASGGVHNR